MTEYDYLKLAYEVARDTSTDPSTQNAAIIVSGSGHVSSGNFFPSGVIETEERWTRPLKYKFVEHAERNAVYLAAKLGFKTEGAVMYVPWFACAECARAIIQSGISEVVGHDLELHKSQGSWKESIEIADQMFLEAGMKFRRIKGEFGVTIRFNGQLIGV